MALLTKRGTTTDLNVSHRLSLAYVALFFVTLSIMMFLGRPAAAQNTTVIEIGTGFVDHDLILGQRWTRVNFSPIISGTNSLRVTWDADAVIRFSVFRINSDGGGNERIATADNTASPAEWSGTLDATEQYYLGVWATSGSADFTATIEATPLTITTQPADLTVTEGNDASFSVVANGSGTLTYQWSANGTAIPDAIGSTLTISPAALTESGTAYSVEVTDENSSIGSDSATLTVEEVPVPLAITTHPADRTVTEGNDASFSVVASGGSGSLAYQWFASTTITDDDDDDDADDGNTSITINPLTEIPGATSNTLTISPATLDNNLTAYSVTISDDNDSIESDIAILTVNEATVTVAISTQPVDVSVIEGSDANFSVVATGSGTLSYQWLANGAAISDAIASSLNIGPTSLSDSGTVYTVEVTDDNGSLVSDDATLTVDEAPVTVAITTQPAPVTVTEGEEAVFTVVATGSGLLSYQWLADSVAIPDAINSSLTIHPTTLGESGIAYSVVVTDDNGSIESEMALLVVEEAILPVSTVTIGQGTVDFSQQAGPRWTRIDFESLATASHTITVAWDSDADVRFNVFEADGTRISQVVRGTNPGIWTGALAADSSYYIGLWSTSGVANYSVSIEATVPVSIVSDPSDLIVTEGDDATFVVDAIGSGTLSYQWFADDIPLSGENTNSLTVFASSLADSGTGYTVEVSNGFETVLSELAVLTVNEPLILGLFSQDADSSAWMLAGPSPTLEYDENQDDDSWGRSLLRVGDLLLVGGDFQGIKPTRSGSVTHRPFLAAFNAVTGQPVSSFQTPVEVNSVVRSIVLSPDSEQVYVGGDFGLLILDATTGELDLAVDVNEGSAPGRVFDIEVTDTQLYIGGDFNRVNNTFRANIARLSLDGELDSSWSPSVTNGFSAGRSAPVQSLAVSPSGDTVYVGGNFRFIDGTPVDMTPQNNRISMLPITALDGSVLPERFSPFVGNNEKGVTAHDIAVTDDYVIVAWGGPNFLTFHALSGERLVQQRATGDVQALQVVGNHVFVGHHGEFFGFLPNVNPPEAVISLDPEIIEPYKFHSFRIDDPTFPAEQAWKISGPFGVWGIAAAEDSIWIAGQISNAGSNERPADGLVRFPALD